MPVKMVTNRPHYVKATRTELKPGEEFTVADESEADRLERNGRAKRVATAKSEPAKPAAAAVPKAASPTPAEGVKPVPAPAPAAKAPVAPPKAEPAKPAAAQAPARPNPTLAGNPSGAAQAVLDKQLKAINDATAEEEAKKKAAAAVPPATYATRDMKAQG